MPAKHILVIESEEEFSNSLKSMFSGYDAEIKVLGDGKDGLAEAKKSKPDIILLCVELPKMSGYSVCKKLKQDKDLKDIPLIIMSSEATEETFESHKKLKTRAEDYIIKPFTSEQILEKVSALIPLQLDESIDDEELILIDDDETIAIEDEQKEDASIDELEESDESSLGKDEELHLDDGEEGTMVIESPFGERGGKAVDDLEKFDDVFNEIKMDEGTGPQQSSVRPGTSKRDESLTFEEPPDSSAAEQSANAADSELSEFNDVLDSLKEVAAGEKPEAKKAVSEDDLLTLEPVQEDVDESISDLGAQEDILGESKSIDDLDKDLGSEPPPTKDFSTAEIDAILAEESQAASSELASETGSRPTDDSDVDEPAISKTPYKSGRAERPADSQLATKLKTAEGDNQLLRDKIQKLEQKLEEAKKAFEKREVELDKSNVAEKQAADSLLATKLKNSEEDNQLLRDKVQKLEQKLEESHKSFEKRDSELGNLRTQSSSKEKEFLSLKAALNSKDREILELKEEINRKEQDILNVQEKAAESQEEMSRLQEMIAQRDKEIKGLSDRVDEVIRDRNQLEESFQVKMAEWDERYTTETATLEHKIQVIQEEQANALESAEERVSAAELLAKGLRGELDDTKQRHSDEMFGLRARSKAQLEKMQEEMNNLQQKIQQVAQRLNEEVTSHEATRVQAVRVPELEQQLENAQQQVAKLEQQSQDLKTELAKNEERVVKAYQKIKGDEKVKEKARKAVEIAFTLLADQVNQGNSEDNQSSSDQGEVQNP